ncbi:MAG: beta-propeller fold lactonase family protein [Planctomycetes bacterium]|nr:beta-propeller fold lactonase family protein [Planctomycetota bacterium]
MVPTRLSRLRGTALSALAALGAFTSSAAAQAPGAVYASTNAVAGNEVAVFTRAPDGTLTFDEFVATGGLGSGAGLGNQGGLVLSDDDRYLYVVDAGSDELSVLRVLDDGLQLVDVVPSRGTQPVSVAQHDDVLYVLNAGSDTVAGFRQRPDGTLVPFGPKRTLSGTGVGAAQVDLSSDGRYLFVTEKATDSITRFRATARGLLARKEVLASDGPTPFGFHVGQRQQLFVSQAAGGASGAATLTSYAIDPSDGTLDVLSGSVASNETAACWVVGTPDGRLVFVSNTGTDSVSSFAVDFDGVLALRSAQAGLTGDAPTDMALTDDGRFLFVHNSAEGSVSPFAVATDGSLTSLSAPVTGLPPGSNGLAAR